MRHTKTITVLYSLPGINFKTSIVLAIYEEAGYSISDLSQDIMRCYRNPNNQKYHQQTLLEDLYYLKELVLWETEHEIIEENLMALFNAIESFQTTIELDKHVTVRLLSIELENPDTAHFNFVTN